MERNNSLERVVAETLVKLCYSLICVKLTFFPSISCDCTCVLQESKCSDLCELCGMSITDENTYITFKLIKSFVLYDDL